MRTGAQALLETLCDAGIEVCFANPGTSEMHLVTAIGQTESVRAVLCLFEGVVTGAADGYARMTDKPALTLLHLGPGLANGMANLHNARKAHVPLVNVVGDHATYHLQYDAPLTSDVAGHARLHSSWVEASESADDLARKGSEAVAASLIGAGRIATLIAPANHAWEEATAAPLPFVAPPSPTVPAAAVERVASLLGNGKRTAFVLGGRALRAEALEAAGRIAAASGATLLAETFATRFARGAGRAPATRIPYFAEKAVEFLAEFDQFVLVAAKEPVGFFAYPNVPSRLSPEGAPIETLAGVDDDVGATLAALVERLGAADQAPLVAPREVPPTPTGELSPGAVAQSIAALMPADSVVVEEGITCGLEFYSWTQTAAPHELLAITGGSIGQGLPAALGAAIACPDRKVVAFQADGSALYTVQALWSMVREDCDVTVVLLNNSSYAILNVELARLGTGAPNSKTLSMLDLGRPDMDWVQIAQGLGMNASRATTAEEFHAQFEAAMTSRGPRLIEVKVVQHFDAGLRR